MSENIQDPHKRLITLEDEITDLVHQLEAFEKIEAEMKQKK
jgi:hypothetical protein